MTTTRAKAGVGARFQTFFKPRDVFLHDGKSLRRFTIGARIQMAVAAIAFAILAWSAFATFQMIRTMNGDVAQMQRQVAQMQSDIEAIRTATAQRAALLERRQVFLAEMLSGHPDADRLAQNIPAAATEFDNPAAQAMTGTFDRVDSMQAELVGRVQQAARQSLRARTVALQQFGVQPARFQQDEGGVGGPYEPVPAVDNADPRFRELFLSWRALDQLQHGVAAIPSAFPLHQGVNFTSGFGIRSDPFRGRAAMHPGVDLAGPVGTPIYATADGMVDRAEWNNGGYGNLVEIDHGHGIQTRYGHLTRYIVSAGQHVKRGQLIAYMGSTGRSTGSHLHYEVRMDGRAVNPVPYLDSAELAVAMKQRVNAMTAPLAQGGPDGDTVGTN